MTTMNISLPDELERFVDGQVTTRGYTSRSEYVRELIRRDQDRESLRSMLLAGAASPLDAQPVDARYFTGLRGQVREWAKPASGSNVAAAPSAKGTGRKAAR